MNSLAKTGYSKRLEQDFSFQPDVKRILFVAPSTCGQLQMARYFWDFYGPEDYEAMFAALENNPVNPWLNTSMRDYDYTLTQKQVESIFVMSTTASEFGCIVSLGGFQNQYSISPFMETLDILFGKSPKRIYWSIPDPENATGNQSELIGYAEDIRNRIEFEVAQLAQVLEEND